MKKMQAQVPNTESSNAQWKQQLRKCQEETQGEWACLD